MNAAENHAVGFVPDNHPVRLCRGNGVRDNEPVNENTTVGAVEAGLLGEPLRLLLTLAELATPDGKEAKKGLPYLLGGHSDLVASGTRGWREAVNFAERDIVTLDGDTATDAFLADLRAGTGSLAGVRYAWHTTVSSTPKHPRLRLFLWPDRPLSATEHRLVVDGLKHAIEEQYEGVLIDPTCGDIAHIMFVPACCADGEYESGSSPGGFLDVARFVAIAEAATEATKRQAEQRQVDAHEQREQARSGGYKDDGPEIQSRWREVLDAMGVHTEAPWNSKAALASECPACGRDGVARVDWTVDGWWTCRVCTKPNGGSIIAFLKVLEGIDGAAAHDRAREILRMPARTRKGGAGAAKTPPPAKEWDEEEPLAQRLGLVTLRDLPEVFIRPEDRLWWDAIVAGHLTLLSGPPGIGKTTLVRNIVRTITTGEEFLHHRGPVGGAGVLVLDYETPPIDRRSKWQDVYGEELSGLVFVSTKSATLGVDDADDIIATAITLGVKCIVVDTIARAFPVEDENNNAAMGKVVATLKQVADAGFAVVVIAHPPKSGGSPVRGAGAIMGAIDILLTFRRHKPPGDGEAEEEHDTNTPYLLSIEKNRSGQEASMRVFRTEDKGFRAPDEPTAEKRSAAEKKVEAVVRAGGGDGITTKAVQARLALDVPERTVERALKALADQGRISNPRRGLWIHREAVGLNPEASTGSLVAVPATPFRQTYLGSSATLPRVSVENFGGRTELGGNIDNASAKHGGGSASSTPLPPTAFGGSSEPCGIDEETF